MKIRFLQFLFFTAFCSCILLCSGVNAQATFDNSSVNKIKTSDSVIVIKMNKAAYADRLINPTETKSTAEKALELATKIGYVNGIAEAHRILGIGFFYLNNPEESLKQYLSAITFYQKSNNLLGQAKVDNNIGTLYRESDEDTSIDYYNKALRIAKHIGSKDLIGSIDLNLGTINYRKKLFSKALEYYNLSGDIFSGLGDTTNMIQAMQNKGVMYYSLHQSDIAKQLLLEANKEAKGKDLNAAIASIDLTLTSLYKDEGNFAEAKKYMDEGLAYAQIVKSSKLISDYQLTRYELEYKRKNYKDAIVILHDIYQHDSTEYRTNVSSRLNLLKVQDAQIQNKQKDDLMVADQKKSQILFWSTVFVAVLLSGFIILLIGNVNRKAKTNKRLTELNAKISEQKENLNQINHHLEEIIDERTKDLQVKNKKLADYSLHLSHQIRGPIATLKGLLNLEKDKLIEQEECVRLMNKCVSEIDDNIIDMSGMLHESNKIKQPV